MSTMVVRDTDRNNTQVNFVLGIPHSYLSLSYAYKFEKLEGRLRAAVKYIY